MYNFTSCKHKHTWRQKTCPLKSLWSDWSLLAQNIFHNTHYAVNDFILFFFSFLRANQGGQANCIIVLVSYTMIWSHHSHRMCCNVISLLSVHSLLMPFTDGGLGLLLFLFVCLFFLVVFYLSAKTWK